MTPSVFPIVGDLSTTERLCLWAVRVWCADHGDVTFAWLKIHRAFRSAGIEDALPAFQQMMSAFFSGLRGWPDIRHIDCPHLGESESALLRALAALQSGDEVSVRHELRTLLTRPAVREVRACAAEYMRVMTIHKLVFTQPGRNAFATRI